MWFRSRWTSELSSESWVFLGAEEEGGREEEGERKREGGRRNREEGEEERGGREGKSTKSVPIEL